MAEIKRKIGILGGGIAGLSLACFLNESSLAVLEKEDRVGGLCRSFNVKGINFDIGPHIIFSKNSQVLEFMKSCTLMNKFERSNQIFLNGKYIKYPFENFLAMMRDKEKIEYCLNSFLNNPYKNLPADNMLAFFLKTFGEGITRTYLQPYNEKIWKFDPAMLDTQMVERIPKPPEEHIINSAKGIFSEGYLHQLYFYYPQKGGYQSLINAIAGKAAQKGAEIYTDSEILNIRKRGKYWLVKTQNNHYFFEKIINCMPIHELAKVLSPIPQEVKQTIAGMLYNSIYVVIVNVKHDTVGKNFAVMVPQKDIIFHRLSKLDFMGANYHLSGSSTFLLEITFREQDIFDQMGRKEIINRSIKDMVRLGFIKSRKDVNFTQIKKEKYAYVIYDLGHRARTDSALSYFKENGIENCGRFAEFEYLNSDKVIEHAMNLAEKINTTK